MWLLYIYIYINICSSELHFDFITRSEQPHWRRKDRRIDRPTRQMWALAHLPVEAGVSCGALAAKRRRFLLFVPGDTTPITLSVGADYLWKPFSLTRAGDVSISHAHSGHHCTSLPHTEACSEPSQSKKLRYGVTSRGDSERRLAVCYARSILGG